MSREKDDIVNESLNRDKVIVRTSLIGIGANILLAAFKSAVGLVTRSIAVTLDAVNNLSDALSSRPEACCSASSAIRPVCPQTDRFQTG